MKKIKVITSKKINKEKLYLNQLEIDYLLTHLYSSFNENKDEYEAKYIERLKELTSENITLKMYI